MEQRSGDIADSLGSYVEQVQLRAIRIFLGVGRLHPKVSLLVEMEVLPLEWVAKLKFVEFWNYRG